MMIKLHLLQDIQYEKASPAGDLRQAYGALVSDLFSLPVGGEACIEILYRCRDSVSLETGVLALKNPPTPSVKDAVDNARPVPPVPDAQFSIPAGEYDFEQLTELPGEDRLTPFLLKFCTGKNGRLFIRILREHAASFAAQILAEGESV